MSIIKATQEKKSSYIKSIYDNKKTYYFVNSNSNKNKKKIFSYDVTHTYSTKEKFQDFVVILVIFLIPCLGYLIHKFL